MNVWRREIFFLTTHHQTHPGFLTWIREFEWATSLHPYELQLYEGPLLWRRHVWHLSTVLLHRFIPTHKNVMNCWSAALCRYTAPLITAESLQRSADLYIYIVIYALMVKFCTEAICRRFKPKLSENKEVPWASHVGHGSVIDFSLLFFTETVKHKEWSQIPPPTTSTWTQHANLPHLEPAHPCWSHGWWDLGPPLLQSQTRATCALRGHTFTLTN